MRRPKPTWLYHRGRGMAYREAESARYELRIGMVLAFVGKRQVFYGVQVLQSAGSSYIRGSKPWFPSLKDLRRIPYTLYLCINSSSWTMSMLLVELGSRKTLDGHPCQHKKHSNRKSVGSLGG